MQVLLVLLAFGYALAMGGPYLLLLFVLNRFLRYAGAMTLTQVWHDQRGRLLIALLVLVAVVAMVAMVASPVIALLWIFTVGAK
jgi:hypothetical protein